ncbi:hypothetical protein HYC85_003646 [Camellia sinensis]|uniref:Kinesin motor domain-containing protein n=1 Tax=Camellia sinensis TaxID=4442 RepID=A0A7J7HW06_CAMSI|nr:hypothetical protein HYC85_003646 [Camellia sinensis]
MVQYVRFEKPKVFRSDCSTKEVYEKEAKDVALSVVSATIFANGQTSSGKTFTMMGITEYAVADIYYYIEKHNEREFLLKFSAMEIYNESVRDLLSTDSTSLRLLDDPERGTVIEKLTEEPLRDWNHVMELLSICDVTTKQQQFHFALLAICVVSQQYTSFNNINNKPVYQALAGGVWNLRLLAQTVLQALAGRILLILREASVHHSHYQLAQAKSGLPHKSLHNFHSIALSVCHIKPLEKEIIDLTVQRDLAQSQVGFNNYPHLQVRKSSECENPVPDTSALASPYFLDIGVRSINRSLYSYGHSGRSSDDHYIQILPEFEENFVPNDTSPQLLADAPYLDVSKK